MIHTLELCSGTGSFLQHTKARGLTPITVDVDPAFDTTHVAYVRLFDYARLYPDKRYFKYIWCSPPCTHYSNAKKERHPGLRRRRQHRPAVSRHYRLLRLRAVVYREPVNRLPEKPAVYEGPAVSRGGLLRLRRHRPEKVHGHLDQPHGVRPTPVCWCRHVPEYDRHSPSRHVYWVVLGSEVEVEARTGNRMCSGTFSAGG